MSEKVNGKARSGSVSKGRRNHLNPASKPPYSPLCASAPLRESSPSGSGEPPAEDAVAFSTWPREWVGPMPRSHDYCLRGRFLQTKVISENSSDVSCNSLKSTVLGVGTARTKGPNSAWGQGSFTWLRPHCPVGLCSSQKERNERSACRFWENRRRW